MIERKPLPARILIPVANPLICPSHRGAMSQVSPGCGSMPGQPRSGSQGDVILPTPATVQSVQLEPRFHWE